MLERPEHASALANRVALVILGAAHVLEAHGDLDRGLVGECAEDRAARGPEGTEGPKEVRRSGEEALVQGKHDAQLRLEEADLQNARSQRISLGPDFANALFDAFFRASFSRVFWKNIVSSCDVFER